MGYFKTDDDVQLYYEEFGHGQQVILFVHGYLDSGDSFKCIAKDLGNQYRVIVYDERAHGLSETPEDGYTIARYARDLKNLIDYLDLSDIHIIGYSMGVHIIYSYIDQFGDSAFRKIILTVMSPKMITDDNYKLGMGGCFTCQDALNMLILVNNSFSDYQKAGYMANLEAIEKNEQLRRYYEKAAQLKPGAMIRLQIAMIAGNYWPVTDKINCPTLIVGAENDIYPAAVYDEQARRIKNATKIVFPDCGHMLMLENPGGYIEAIDNFFGTK